MQRRLCTPAQLAAELREGSQRGSATPRRVLVDVSEGIRSTAERDAKRLVARSGLPAPWWNVAVYDERGRLLGIADAWFDEVALAWEINSYAWHLNPESYAREITRTADMTAANVVVLPVLPTALHRDRGWVDGRRSSPPTPRPPGDHAPRCGPGPSDIVG